MTETTPGHTSTEVDQSIALLAAREDAAVWQTRAAYLQAQAERAAADNAALAAQAATLTAQLAALQAHAAALQTRLAQSEALREAERAAATALTPLASAVPRPPIVDIIAALPRSADVTNQYQQRPLAAIRRLVVHHAGDATDTARDVATLHVNDPQHQWPGIGFHFFVAADGAIYQTNRLETISYHLAEDNAATAGIALAGSFDAAPPPDAQLAATAALLAWLIQELRLPLESIAGHSDLAQTATACPGATWGGASGWKATLLSMVRQRNESAVRPIYHYVLFWQTESDWAEADWQAATAYIARVRPAAGFSTQEAARAANVTIVGGPEGVSLAAEAELRAAGCRVQRIAGKNARETRRLLETLARDGQRFAAPQDDQ